jgi:hypothetical protein
MRAFVDELMKCFPNFEEPIEKPKPTEFPFPYTYKVLFHRGKKTTTLMVYHQQPELFPGIWRHPDGEHLYFEGEASWLFMDLVRKSGVNSS